MLGSAAFRRVFGNGGLKELPIIALASLGPSPSFPAPRGFEMCNADCDQQLNVLGTLVWIADEFTGNRYRSMLQVRLASRKPSLLSECLSHGRALAPGGNTSERPHCTPSSACSVGDYRRDFVVSLSAIFPLAAERVQATRRRRPGLRASWPSWNAGVKVHGRSCSRSTSAGWVSRNSRP